MVNAMRARRAAIITAALLAQAGAATALAPAGPAAVCGPGTFYDAPTDSCLVAAVEPAAGPASLPAPPPPPPPPPPAWNGPTPYVSASVCAPIPILNLCVGI